jgi:hypothetical protein
MPSPFPGMDPYLEKPSGWSDVHQELISATRAALKALIGPKYHVRIEERIYISNDTDPGRIVLVPDVQVSSRDVDARSLTTAAKGGIDVAEPLVLETLIYLVHFSPTHRRPLGLVWPIRLSQRFPIIPIPVRAGDDDAPLDLQAILDTAYDHAGYETDIDYTGEPVPPLGPHWNEWSERWLREKGLRPQQAPG